MVKMNEEEFKDYVGNNIKSISSKISLEEINFLSNLVKAFNEVCEKYDKSQNNWNELKKWLESKGTSTKEENDALCYFYTYKKIQELEQGKDDTNIL